ncbi:MAG: DNA helicase UvrD, partial [Anaerolineales bacterium]
MPNAPAHPEAPAEDEHLRHTLAILDRRIESVGSIDLYGPTEHDTAALHAQMVKIYRDLELARENVYFGRLDLLVEGSGKSESHYIGRIGFDERGKIVVVDWRAPVARLFSRRRPGSVGYESPDGFRHVELRLKRHVVLDRQSLRDIFDEYDTRPDSPTAGEAVRNLVDPDAYLRQILSGRRDAQMGDIVATIQEHQDELIRAAVLQVLLIQGAAGSGKTSVALHRLAYLLYPGNKFNLNPDRCIIFGPNQLFLGYISNVLPG